MPLRRVIFPKEVEPLVETRPAPPKFSGSPVGADPELAYYRAASKWNQTFEERGYAAAVEDLKRLVRSDFADDPAKVDEVVPCIIDYKEGRTKKEEEQIRRVLRRFATIFAGFTDRMVRYNPESRPYAWDWLKQQMIDYKAFYRPYLCEAFRAAKEGREVEPKKRSPGGINDWGKTKPYWCVTCGYGFGSPEQVVKHYERTKHATKRATDGLYEIGAKGLSQQQKDYAWRVMNK